MEENNLNPVVKAALADAMVWPLESVPFQTTRSAWAVWVHPDAGRWMYIEHVLIAQVHATLPQEQYHDVFMTMGHKLLKALNVHGDPDPGMVREGIFQNCPVQMRFGNFGGRIFVFVPRPEFEKHLRG